MAPLPDAATKAPGITAETIKGVDTVAVDSEGDPLGEGFADFAVDNIRDRTYLNYRIRNSHTWPSS